MRKKVFGRKLSRDSSSRQALFRSLIKALVKHGKINTTKAKAKSILPDAEKLVNLAKNKNMLILRRAYSYLANDSETTSTLFEKIGPAFKNRQSGFLRSVNLPRRKGDFAEMVRLEWTEKIEIIKKDRSGKSGQKTKKSKEGVVEQKPAETEKKGLRSRVAGLLKSKKK